MKVYRARAIRAPQGLDFDPLDASGSVSGPLGWRFNDIQTPILYTAEVEALATLEVAVRPGWHTIAQVLIATIDIPDESIANLSELGIVLPSNWNARPAAPDSRSIAREFLSALAALPSQRTRPLGVRVPSVLSGSDHNVLLDPSRRSQYSANVTFRLAFNTLANTAS